MTNLLITRFIQWRKQWIVLLFWAVFPILSTMIIITFADKIQEDTKIPVGLVLKDETPLVADLYDSLQTIPLIKTYQLDEVKALDLLEKHQLDSVFIIHKGYEKNIRKGNRNRLITGYQSDVSLAYLPVQESILSYIQQDAGRSKAAHVVNQLSKQYTDSERWTWETIIEKNKQIQLDQHLLQTIFSFANTHNQSDILKFTLFKPWSIWAISTFLSTFLLFDWPIKERRPHLMPRLAFMYLSLKSYLMKHLIIYTILLLVFDLLALICFYFLLEEMITISLIKAIFFYRILINLGAFLSALPFKSTFTFYCYSFVITLFMAIGSGAILPIEGIVKRYPWFEWVNPLQAFLSVRWFNIWIFICMMIFILWYVKGDENDASCE